jgi:uncharacterized protein (TIGR03086 family)
METGHMVAGSPSDDGPMTDHASPSPATATAATLLEDPRPQLHVALTTAGSLVAELRPDELGLPTPCGAFDVEGLVAHLVAVVERIETIGRTATIGAVPDSIEVPLGELPARWAEASTRAEAAWAVDDHLERTVRVPWDTMPGRDALAVYVNELTVHTWDIARATGRDVEWDDAVLIVSEAAMHQQLPEPARGPMWAAFADALGEAVDPPFGDAVPVAPDAPAIDRVVAWNGRRP